MTALGNHAVGIRPRMARVAISTTATSLFPPLATKRVWPSGETATALGIEPMGASGYGERSTAPTTVSVAVSMALTVSLVALATKRRVPSGDSASPLACAPVGIRRSTVPRAASMTVTPPPFHSDT